MIRSYSLPVFLFLLLPNLIQPVWAQERIRTVLHDGWVFAQGAQPEGASPGLDDQDWTPVHIPHDWAIAGPFDPEGDGSTGKLPWRGEGWCRRALDIPAEAAGQRLYLHFDGVMAFLKVYVNGRLVGGWDYGHNSFYLDITDYLSPGGPICWRCMPTPAPTTAAGILASASIGRGS
ncbi:MAG: hypothetical protein D6722_09275 [Bacteroidetes bacterium]|nr:MAG: hypothetical protein D6722_09275 [Bacteroidota bacterium]